MESTPSESDPLFVEGKKRTLVGYSIRSSDQEYPNHRCSPPNNDTLFGTPLSERISKKSDQKNRADLREHSFRLAVFRPSLSASCRHNFKTKRLHP